MMRRSGGGLRRPSALVAGYRVAADESIQIEDLHSIVATVSDS
jgi:hypothetical protein